MDPVEALAVEAQGKLQMFESGSSKDDASKAIADGKYFFYFVSHQI